MKNRYSFSFLLAAVLTLAIPSAIPAGEISLSPAGGRIYKSMRSFQEMRESRVTKQRWDLSCGAAALSTLLSFHYGDKVSEAAIIASLLHRVEPRKIRERGGFSLLDLKRYAESRGYEGKGYAGLTLQELADLPAPAIVPVRIHFYDHFVVFRGIQGNRVLLADSALGTMTMRTENFLEIWKKGIGFVILRPGAPDSPGGLSPKPEDFFIPDGTAMMRSLLRTGTLPPTRNGL
jgi:hypothetical protein